MFLQIHFLTSHHASLLNRDDAGLAKRITFGGATRIRVSSQCQKKHWRDALMQELRDLPFGIRSRRVFQKVAEEAAEQGLSQQRAMEVTRLLAEQAMTHGKGRQKSSVFDDPDHLGLGQPVLFGYPEVRYLASIVVDAAKTEDPKKAIEERFKGVEKKNLQILMREAGFGNPICGVEGALFGRFVTSDILSRVDAPVHVAHAFTVHALDTELDYFTVVDDLGEEREETGAAHVNETELGAGIFYGYVVVDVPLLVSNFTGCKREKWQEHRNEPAIRRVLQTFLQIVAQVSPGAKLGSTAPYAWAEFVMLEAGKAQPRSLANAFLRPVRLDPENDPMQEAVDRLAGQLDSLQAIYGDMGEARWVATNRNWPRTQEATLPLGQAVEAALDAVLGTEGERL